ncbi:galactokinase [Parageobacillus thermoglucosidasius]|uniref:galactokinase n=1 Tax=Parageobacillus thermoglucosidasius TaxID=1426 RepID=UPI000B579F7F|nr:galactokinase [Parageobacillus thermoglucosidasius]MBY6269729.1 galactokinase [Parageobacillus thermoglucosidasius]OUM85464.1 MAG: galactokinase [Parageobacillus thermoglucosidasius]
MMTNWKEEFIQLFAGTKEDIRIFFAPGRVNFIGEHIDYNGGHVLPCALEIGTYALVRKTANPFIRFYSKNFPETGIITVAYDDLSYQDKHGWANYPKGVIAAFQSFCPIETGLDILYYGMIPNGAGLSSSASIELVTAVMLNELFAQHLDMLELVKLSQKVENEYVGVNCGIMDQFAVGMGKRNHAMLLNCQTLECRYIPVAMNDCSIVIANTNKKRGLAASVYNERRATCEAALAKLQKHINIASLGDLTIEQLEKYKHLLSPLEQKRARHAVTENERTIEAAAALEKGDLLRFGELMKQSHISLRDDYEVTGEELDTLVEAAWKHEGTIGARMTGAGFGGCTVNIVKDAHIPDFIERVGKEYAEKIGYEASFYVVKIGDGAREITETKEMSA